jgi:hypothetical protein
MSPEKKNEEKALIALTACYMNELSSLPCFPWAEKVRREGLVSFNPDRMLTHLTADGESLVDAVLEQVYAKTLESKTAVLRSLNICCEDVKEHRRQEVADLIAAGYLQRDEYEDDALHLTEKAFDLMYLRVYPNDADLHLLEPKRVSF